MMVGARKVLISLIGIGLALAAGMAAAQTAAPQMEVPNLVMPRMTTARALYFKNNPEAFTQFKAQLQGRPSGATVANRSQANAPTFGGSWQNTSAPSSGMSNPLLLTDGSVIVHNGTTQNWFKLTPNNNGSYASGTWTTIAQLPAGYAPQYFASAVLPDGRVIIQGGEYNFACDSGLTPIWTSLGAIYAPLTNVWTSVSPPSGTHWTNTCLLYTSDAADEEDSVDLGGR